MAYGLWTWRRKGTPVFDLRTSATMCVLVGLGFATAGCEIGLPAGSEPHRELNFLDMADQPKAKPQRSDLLGEGRVGMMAPPEGAVSVNEEIYPYTQEQGELAAAVSNPLVGEEVVAHGKFVFDNVCITCHGPEGAGNGHLTKLFPKPPSLMTQKVRDWSDGRIFHLPMRGQGSMPSHSKQLESHDIWSVIHYIRTLQGRLPVAPPADLAVTKDGGQP